MALESVLLALLGVVAVWLVVDAGRERRRLRSRIRRCAQQAARDARPRPTGGAPATPAAGSAVGGLGPDGAAWPYWPLSSSGLHDLRLPRHR